MKISRSELLAIALAIGCAVGVGMVQPVLQRNNKKIRLGADTTSLPPPRQLKALALGYNAAGADLLWAKLLVEHGIHASSHREFEGVPRYVDGILELDRDHPMIYRYLDTMLVMAKPGVVATEADVRLTRRYFERGTADHPYDSDLWLTYGQFLAFLAPTFIVDSAEQDRWRRDGAFAILHAVDLGANAERSLSASSILSRAGESKAAIKQLQRAYALSDEPDTRQQISLKLQRLQASSESEDVITKVEQDWQTYTPFLTRGAALLVGPFRAPAACAGPASNAVAACAGDWSTATASH